MALNWGKVNNNTQTKKAATSKTGLDWGKVGLQTTQPMQTNPQHAQLAQDLAGATSIRTANDIKQEERQRIMKELTSGEPSAFIPPMLNAQALEDTQIQYEKEKKEKAKNYLPQLSKNITAGVASGVTSLYDYGKALGNELEYKFKFNREASNLLADYMAGDKEKGEEDFKQAVANLEKEKQAEIEADRAKTQWARDNQQAIMQGNQNYNGLGKGLLNAANTASRMFSTSPLGAYGIFGNAAGGAYNQAMDAGADSQKALAYATTSGTLETGVEMASGGAAQKLLNIPAVGKINNITENITNPFLRGTANVVGDVLGEGGEEVITALLDPYIQKATYNPNAGFTSWSEAMTDAGNAFVESILPTLLMGGTSYVVDGVNSFTNKQIEKIQSSKLSQNEKQQLINQVQQQGEQIIAEQQKNNALESAQMQEITATNEVIPQEDANQETANVAQNTANTQKMVQNEAEIEQSLGIEQQKTTEPHVSKNISKDIDNVLNNIKERNPVRLRDYTPSILVQNGIKDLPMYENPSHIRNNILTESEAQKLGLKVSNKNHYHGLGKDTYIKTIESLDDPRVVLRYKNDPNQYIILTVVKDNQGNNIIVPIQVETDTYVNKIKVDINRIKSVYGYDRTNPDLNKYIKDSIKNNNLEKIYEKKKPSTSKTSQSTSNNIIQPVEKYVNNQQENMLPTAEQLNQPSQEMIEGAQALTLEEPKKRENTGFILVNPEDSYKRNIINNNAKAMNDLIKAKRIVSDDFDAQIKKKQDLLNSKKDKTTKVAQTLQNQIINLQNRKANAEEKFLKQIDRLKNKNEKMKKQVADDRLPTREEIKQDIITQTDLENINLDNAKDLSKFIMNNTTPLRVNEKVFDRATAEKINNTFFRPIKVNEAERIRFLNKERNEIKSLGIEPNSKESEYVQIYGEGEWVNPETGETTPYTLKDLKKDFPEDWEKIKAAAEKIREKYDTYLDTVNKELNKMGYDSIPKLKNYFRHFEATTSLLEQIGIPSKADHLPTDMNGLTSDLRPGKNFFANALSRTGKKTTYDAIAGIDGYLEGVSKLMYHTEDIQKLRTFDEYIRNKYGQSADLEGLNKQEFNEKVQQIQEGHLSEYAAWLSEYTNALAGKKSKMDRGTEEALGRRIYGTLNAVKKQVGSNLTGLNLNSALSNFISITQAGSKTSKFAMLEGLGDTVKSIFEEDGFINKSDFLTRRFGSDKLSKTAWEKMSNAGQIFMAGTDYFSANLITRSKYHEYLNKGYPENEAMKLADEFADRLMGGRALGDMPNIFNSKTLGILTQFQLENVNQFDSIFHDTKYEDRIAEQTKYDAKTWNEKFKSKLAKEKPEFYNSLSATLILGQLFAYAWAYNKIDEELTGSGGAFDPIGIIEDLIKDFTNPDLTKGQAIANLTKNIIDVIPYANIITGGGRVPMTDALPNIVDLLEGESTVGSELWKLANLALPTGGGQLRKSIQGLSSVIKGGDYTSDNRLKFQVAQEGNIWQKIAEGAQALAFGKWATPGGQKYIEDGFKPLSAVQTEGLERAQDMGIETKEFYDIMNAIEEIEVPKRKNAKGKEEAVPGARKQLIKEELNSRKELTTEQKKLLYDIFYSKEL